MSDWWFTYPGGIAIGTYIGTVAWITKWWVERKDKNNESNCAVGAHRCRVRATRSLDRDMDSRQED